MLVCQVLYSGHARRNLLIEVELLVECCVCGCFAFYRSLFQWDHSFDFHLVQHPSCEYYLEPPVEVRLKEAYGTEFLYPF